MASDTDESPRARRAGVKRTAWTLGIAGLIPFVVMTAVIAYAGRDFIAFPQLILALSGYSAVILSFLGGIRWGSGLWMEEHGRHILALSVLPSVAGWLFLFIPSPWMFAAFALGFLLQGVWDVVAAHRRHLPLWFRRLRVVLTIIVVLCMAVAFAATWPGA